MDIALWDFTIYVGRVKFPTSPQRLLNHCAEFLFDIYGVWNMNGVFGIFPLDHTTTDCNYFYFSVPEINLTFQK